MKLSPIEYARSARSWTGQVKVDSFARLRDEIELMAEVVDVSLHFELDEELRIRVTGTVEVQAKVPCHLCTHQFERVVKASIDARIARNETEARELAQEYDVIEVSETPVAISELIEDDLILSIPWRICEHGNDCKFNQNQVRSDQPNDKSSSATNRPFANLADLLKN